MMMRMILFHKDLFIRFLLILTTVLYINNTLLAQTFKVNGNAYSNASYGANYYTLTQAAAGQNGSLWYDKMIDLTFPFTFNYSVYQGNTSTGADGMAFVLQQVGTGVIGGAGSGMGYGGITNSLELEYDTYVNADFQAYDPAFDHMGLMKNGEYHHYSDATKKLSTDLVKPVGFSSNVKDGKFHTSSIQWNPTTKTLVAYFDGKKVLTYTGDIIKNIFNNNIAVYFGFTGSTGSSKNEHSVYLNTSSCSYTEYAPLILNSNIGKGETCLGAGNGSDDISISGGTPPYSFTFGTNVKANISPATGSTTVTSSFTNLTAATYAVKITDSKNRSLSTQVIIPSGAPFPKIYNVGGGGGICSGVNTLNSITLSGSESGVNYLLHNNGVYVGTISGTGTAISFDNIGAVGTYTVKAVNAVTQCVSQMNGSASIVNSTLSSPISISIANSNKINSNILCSGTSADLSVIASSNATLNYVWNNGGVAISSTATSKITVSNAGSYGVTVTDGYGCSVTATPVDISVDKTLPTINVNSTSTSVCTPGTISLSGNPSGSSYHWSSGESTPSIEAASSGDYIYSVTTAGGCTVSSTPTSVTINPLPPVPFITAPASLKYCGTTQLMLTATNGSNYSWNLVGATSSNTKSSTLNTTLVEGLNSFTVSNTSNEGCVSTSKEIIIVDNAAPTSFFVSGDKTYCSGKDNATIVLSGSEVGIKYELINNSVSTGITQVGTGSPINFSLTPTDVKNVYTIVATNTNTLCTNPMNGTATVNVNPTPTVPSITFSSNSVCVGSAIQLQNSLAGGVWSSVDPSIANIDGSGKVNGMIAGNVQINYTLTNSSNCSNYASTNITVNPTPVIPIITASGPVSFCPSGSVDLTSNAAIGNLWTITNSNTATTTATVSGEYSVTVTNGFNCSSISNSIIVDAIDHLAPKPSTANLPDLNIQTGDVIQPPTAIDDCSGNISATTSDLVTYPKPGTYQITWTYTDDSKNFSTQIQKVIVKDLIPPTISCVPNITQNNGKDTCGTVVNYKLPLLHDNVSSTPISISDGYGDNSIVFELPTTNDVSNLSYTSSGKYQDVAHGHGESINITVSLFNPSNNVWTDVQTIQTGIGDYHFGGTNTNFETTISQVSKIRFTASKPVGASLHFYELIVNLNSIGLTQTAGLPSGVIFPVGTTKNTFTATDQAGNTSSCSFDVTIIDSQKPVIQPITSVTQTADETATWLGSAATIHVSENCEVISISEQYIDPKGNVIASVQSNNISKNYALGIQKFLLGVNKVVLIATDASGNISDPVSFNVTVVDQTSPTISTPINIIQKNDLGSCGAYVKLKSLAPVAHDNVGVMSFVNDYPGGTADLVLFPVGVTVIKWTATDFNGNVTTATQTITVNDVELPVIINLPVDIAQTNDLGSCGAIVTWPQVLVVDNCGAGDGISGTLTLSSNYQSGATFSFGVTTVTYTATDSHGNTATGSFKITVTDNEAPKTIPKPISITLNNGVATIQASDVDNGSIDNCGSVTLSVSKTNFTCNDIGNVPVVLTATDQFGNTSSVSTIVTVIGQQLSSTISVTPSNNVYTGGNPTDIYIGYGPQSATISDNVVGTPTSYTWSGTGLSCTNCSAPVFNATTTGLNRFTVTASNQYGCTTTSTVSFCVRDIRVTATVNSNVNVCHTNLTTGAITNLQLAPGSVANQLALNPQDKLGAFGLLPCTSNIVNAVAPIEAVQLKVVNTIEIDKLSVKVSPNPSSKLFVLTVSSGSKLPVRLRLTDLNGRIMEAHQNIPLNMPIRVGGELIAGLYIAEVVQGSDRIAVKLIKQNR
jgi:hypothetical protein